VLIGLSGQVIATLLTEYGADLGAQLQLWTASPADRPDVGVSYVMFSVLAAGCLLLGGRPRVVGIAATSGWASLMFAMSPGMTSTGHLLSVGLGLATMQLAGRPSRSQAPCECVHDAYLGHPSLSTRMLSCAATPRTGDTLLLRNRSPRSG
jgi:hypothetical protein